MIIVVHIYNDNCCMYIHREILQSRYLNGQIIIENIFSDNSMTKLLLKIILVTFRLSRCPNGRVFHGHSS